MSGRIACEQKIATAKSQRVTKRCAGTCGVDLHGATGLASTEATTCGGEHTTDVHQGNVHGVIVEHQGSGANLTKTGGSAHKDSVGRHIERQGLGVSHINGRCRIHDDLAVHGKSLSHPEDTTPEADISRTQESMWATCGAWVSDNAGAAELGVGTHAKHTFIDEEGGTVVGGGVEEVRIGVCASQQECTHTRFDKVRTLRTTTGDIPGKSQHAIGGAGIERAVSCCTIGVDVQRTGEGQVVRASKVHGRVSGTADSIKCVQNRAWATDSIKGHTVFGDTKGSVVGLAQSNRTRAEGTADNGGGSREPRVVSVTSDLDTRATDGGATGVSVCTVAIGIRTEIDRAGAVIRRAGITEQESASAADRTIEEDAATAEIGGTRGCLVDGKVSTCGDGYPCGDVGVL